MLHAGVVPDVDLATWRFTVDGLVAESRTWTWAEMAAMPTAALTADIHCVTKWTKFDTEWEGVPVVDVWAQIQPDPTATHVLVK